MKKLAILVLALSGCATHSGVIQDGKDSYLVIVSQGMGFSSAGDLKASAYKEAHLFCRRNGKRLETISEKIVQQGLLYDSAEADVKFRCIEVKKETLIDYN
jgi:hypothetical protein